jgi:hypothetical protein
VTARTLVGSGPRRRTLPLGREAAERALAAIKFHGAETAGMSSAYAFNNRINLDDMWAAPPAAWLPSELRSALADELRERLRGYP